MHSPFHQYIIASVQELQCRHTLVAITVSFRFISHICRDQSTIGMQVHFVVFPYTFVLRKAHERSSEITKAWWTSCAENVFVWTTWIWYQRSHFWYLNNCTENASRRNPESPFSKPRTNCCNFPSGAARPGKINANGYKLIENYQGKQFSETPHGQNHQYSAVFYLYKCVR